MAILSKANQVAAYLRSALADGRWQAGDALPVERELAIELEVSRGTIRDALNLLASEGLLIRKQGSGTFVGKNATTGSVAILAEAKLLGAPIGAIDRQMIEVAQRVIREDGYRPVLSIGDGKDVEEFMSSLHLFDPAVLKDTLGVLNTVMIAPVESRLASAGVPCVALEGSFPQRQYSVTWDADASNQMIVDIFSENDAADFTIFAVDYSQEPIGELGQTADAAGRKQMLGMVDGNPDRIWPVLCSMDMRTADRAFREWWNSGYRTRGLYVNEETMFKVISETMREMGIKAPDDLFVVVSTSCETEFDAPGEIVVVAGEVERYVQAGWDLLRELITLGQARQPVVQLEPNRTAARWSAARSERDVALV